MLAQWLRVIPVLRSHLCPLRKVNRLQCISEAELFSKPSVMHSLNSNVKAISKHRGPRMHSKHRERHSWVFRLRHEGVTGRSNASTWALCVRGCVSAVKWSFVRWGVKVRSPGGDWLPCINSTRRLCHSAGTPHRWGTRPYDRINTRLASSALTHCPRLNIEWREGRKRKGGCQFATLAEEVN